MKNYKNKFLVLLLLFIFATKAESALNEIPTSSENSTQIGKGYETTEEKFVGKCVSGNMTPVGKEESNISFSQTISQKSLAKELGFEQGASFRYGVVSFSESSKFLQSTKETSHSISAIYTGSYSFFEHEMSNIKVNSFGKNFIDNPEKFRKHCGDYFAYKQKRGAKIFFSIRIDFKSKDAKKDFEAKFSLSGPMFSVSANLKEAEKSFSKDTKVTVSAYQIGGDVSKLTNIFKDQSQSNNPHLGQKNFITCSFGQLSACENVLRNAITYATSDVKGNFPGQLKRNSEFGENNGASVLSTYVQPYTYAINVQEFSKELEASIKVTRKSISLLFENVKTVL